MAEPISNANDAHLNTDTGIIAWFTRNPVAANLLMITIIIAGIYSALTIRQQMFPMQESNIINVSITYRGASPQEVEETITTKVEEAFKSVEGLERIITRSRRGVATATLEILDGYDPLVVLDDVKTAIDAISSFPVGMEPPRVSYQKFRQAVMWAHISGDVPLRQLKQLGKTIQDELRALPEVNIVDFHEGAAYEIAIEVSQDKLREYNLSFNEIANAVRSFSTNRSAGEVKANEGYISVRVEDQAYVGNDFEFLPLRTLADGTLLRLKDVAAIHDGFEETINYAKLDGVNSLTFFIAASTTQSITDVADSVLKYMEERRATLPEGIRLEPWADFTYYLKGRLNMMLENMFWGGILVFLILTLFLRTKLAFWVMMGLPVSFLGALALLPLGWFDVTINVVSLFAFIMVLGVVVDDAIIIGESIYTETQDHGLSLDHVIRGAQRVALPATFGVLTTMAAFLPMVLETGPRSAMTHAIGFVVMLCLFFSLVESKLILPAHLAAMKPENPNSNNPFIRFRRAIDSWLADFVMNKYTPFMQRALHYRYSVLMAFIGLIVLTVGLFASGHIRMTMMPKIPHDFATITLEMNPDAPETTLLDGMLKLDAMIREVEKDVIKEFGQPMIEKVLMYNQGRTSAKVEAKLVDPELRSMSTFDLTALWRKKMPSIPNMKSITIQDSVMGRRAGDGDLSFRLKSRDITQLQGVAEAIKTELEKVKGVSEINDSEQPPAQEIRFKLKPVAHSLGLTTNDVAAQTSFSLYGIEAQRIMRDRQEIRVMVRYPKEERNTLASVNSVLIRTPSGAEVPLEEVAELELAKSVNEIYREDGSRAITIWATVDAKVTESLKVADDLKTSLFPELRKRYPGVQIEEAGTLKRDREGLAEQILSILLIMLPIYVLLALPLKSYAQPLMIMSVIPFGIIGAILGHLLLGHVVSRMSMFGIFAVVGVVVNDSLVLVDYVNRARERGETLIAAVLHAGQKRFRAILLTSLTTFIGLIPIMSETSLQAQIVIPMAISLAFGVMFSTLVTLILVPSIYLVSEDIARGWHKAKAILF